MDNENSRPETPVDFEMQLIMEGNALPVRRQLNFDEFVDQLDEGFGNSESDQGPGMLALDGIVPEEG